MNIHDSLVSQDGALKVTLTAFDSKSGQGRLKIEELKAERGRFYVTVTYGEAGQTRIDYKTYDLKKASEFPFTTNRNDTIASRCTKRSAPTNAPSSNQRLSRKRSQSQFAFRLHHHLRSPLVSGGRWANAQDFGTTAMG